MPGIDKDVEDQPLSHFEFALPVGASRLHARLEFDRTQPPIQAKKLFPVPFQDEESKYFKSLYTLFAVY